MPAVQRHIGLYAYRAGGLKAISAAPPCALEEVEKLEQLRALWLGSQDHRGHGRRTAVAARRHGRRSREDPSLSRARAASRGVKRVRELLESLKRTMAKAVGGKEPRAARVAAHSVRLHGQHLPFADGRRRVPQAARASERPSSTCRSIRQARMATTRARRPIRARVGRPSAAASTSNRCARGG